MFWVLVDRAKLLLFLGALTVPFLALGVGLVLGRRGAAPGGKSTLLSGSGGFCLGLVAMPVLLYFAVCTPPPGEGLRARDGYRRGAAISAALDRFRQAEGQYPASLAALVPHLLPADSIAPPGYPGSNYPWEYTRGDSSSYALAFRYTGPGMNRCEYSSANGRWKCGGYF